MMIKYTARIQIAAILSIMFFHLRSNIAYSWHFSLIWNSSSAFLCSLWTWHFEEDSLVVPQFSFVWCFLMMRVIQYLWQAYHKSEAVSKGNSFNRNIFIWYSSCQICCFLSSRSTMLNDTRLAIKQAQKRVHTQKAGPTIDHIFNCIQYTIESNSLSTQVISYRPLSVATIMTSLSSINFSKEGRENSTWKITPHFNRSINENFDTFITKHNHFPLESS